jgi:perosamine synthetase
MFRNHGITRDPERFSPLTSDSSWYYEMQDLGYNYRITDIQCALGISQLQKLPKFLNRRREIAALYDEALADIPGIEPLGLRADVLPAKQSAMRPGPSSMLQAPSSMPSIHAYHLYVVRLSLSDLTAGRSEIFCDLREMGIGVNVHYIPVHLQPFYKHKFNTSQGLCPAAEAAYEQIISLPLFPGMTDEDVKWVITNMIESIELSIQ